MEGLNGGVEMSGESVRAEERRREKKKKIDEQKWIEAWVQVKKEEMTERNERRGNKKKEKAKKAWKKERGMKEESRGKTK